MFNLGTKNLPSPQSNQKTNLERETRTILIDFPSRLHVCDNKCFLLYTPICSGRSSIIWATNSSNLFGAGACETATSCTRWFNTVWTICHVLAKEGAELSSPTDLRLVLFLTALVPACCMGTFGKSLLLCKEATNRGIYLPSAEDEEVLYEI